MSLITESYNHLRHLKIARPYFQDIKKIDDALINFSQEYAQQVASEIVFKYKRELQQISEAYNQHEVKVGKAEDVYKDYKPKDYIENLNYLRNCVIVIASVRLGFEKDIPTYINKLENEL